MKAPLILAACLAAAVTSAAVSWVMTPTAGAATPPADTTALTERLAELERKLDELARRELTAAAPAARENVPSVDPAAIERGIRAWLTENAARPEVAATLAKAAGAEPVEAAFDPATTATALWQLDWEEQAERWQELSKEERAALVEHIETLAKAQPNSADMQVRLGEAYVQMILAPGTGFMEMAKWGQLSDRQFTKALELDDHHWDARFNKAMGLAHQPAILGSRPKAIEHFETLLGQQERLAPEARHAQVYLVLGNLWAEQGDKEKAREIWERGSKRHPSSRELTERLKN